MAGPALVVPVPDVRGGVVRSLVSLLLAAGVGACAPDPKPSSGPTWEVQVEYGSTGGLCMGPDDGGGACRRTVLVRDDGTWSASGRPPPPDSAGTAEPGAATALATLLEEGWNDLTSAPFTGTCPVAYDGAEFFYTLRKLPRGPGAERADAVILHLRSCSHDLEHAAAAPWIAAFHRNLEELGLPQP